MELRFFTQFQNLVAGFSGKPDKSDGLRNEMAREAEKNHTYLVRPILVHGTRICCVVNNTGGQLPCDEIPEENCILLPKQGAYLEIPETDGLVTNLPGVRLTSTHGDCIPLYAYDPVKQVIGLAHAGWKGTVRGIATELIETMRNRYGSSPADIFTCIGPGIGKCHFEFGKKEAETYFFGPNPWTLEYAGFHENPDKLYLDLKGINRHFLELAGVTNIEISPDCTYCMEDRYYSYRRSRDSDRMLAYIELKQDPCN